MTKFKRFAIYYLPDDPEFAALGAHWLGWDCVQGRDLQTNLDREFVKKSAKYGFHATLKAPFRLHQNADFDNMRAAIAKLANQQNHVSIEGLELTKLGRFFALTPTGDVSSLNHLAERCVREFDQFRAALTREEIAKKSPDRLSPSQLEYLNIWGYPHIFENFRFHMTLSDKLQKYMQTKVQERAQNHFQGWLNRPLNIQSICLAGEDSDGWFHMIERYKFGA